MYLRIFNYFDKTPDELNELLNSIDNQADKADIYCALGYFSYLKHDLDSAVDYYDKAYLIYTELKDTHKTAFTLSHLALFNYFKDKTRLIRSHTMLNDSMALVQNEDNDEANDVKAIVLFCNGIIEYNEKNFSQALNLYKKAMSMTIADSLVYARIIENMGLFYLRSSNFHIAINYLEDALKIKEKYNIPIDIATTKLLIGRCYISVENHKKALQMLSDAQEIMDTYKDTFALLRIQDEVAKIYISLGEYEKARNCIETALKKCENFKEHKIHGYLNCTLVSVCIKTNEIDKAINLLQSVVIPIFDGSTSARGIALVRELKAEIFVILKKYDEALDNLYKALDIFKSIKLSFEEAKCYFEIAKIYKQIENPQRVVQNLLEALNITSANEFPILNKKIEDFLYETDTQEWANIINKTARKEKIFSESNKIIDSLSNDLLGIFNDQSKKSKDPLLALLRLGRLISSQTDISRLIVVIAEEAKNALNADRCTIFLYDKEKHELWSKVATGMDSKEIRFSADSLAGYVLLTGETLNIPDVYKDERFNPEIDKQTGYKTQSMLCMPIRNLDHKIIGVLQVLNKQGGKYFTNEDEDLLMSIGSTASIALENANLFSKQQQMIEEQQKSFTSFVNTLATSIDARDKITAGHSIRVTKYTKLIAEQMNFDEDKIDAFEKAALLHDIGKIGIQDSVLLKEGKLTPEEYKDIQKHAKITSDILNQMYFTEKLKAVPEIAASHHEKFDGSGYFRGKKGEEIHIGGRILAVSDVFDAITSKRHYRDRMEISNVLKILREGSGTHFDPNVIDAFFSISLDKILNILISTYDKTLPDEKIEFFKNYNFCNYEEYTNKSEKSETEQFLLSEFDNWYFNRAED